MRSKPLSSADISIGDMSRRTGRTIETIRYYEKIGLLPAPLRTRGGHRAYRDHHFERLTVIRRSRELGLSIAEIRRLLTVIERGGQCGEVQEIMLAHLQTIRSKIADLQRTERILAEATARCEGKRAPSCPVVETLSIRQQPGGAIGQS